MTSTRLDSPARTAVPTRPQTRANRSPLVFVTTALVAVLVMGGCLPSSPQGSAGKHTLTVGVGGYPQSLHPNRVHEPYGFSIYRAIYDSLTIADSTKGGSLQPDLATSWTLVNQNTWQFKLRQDVKWHDGTPFTADDVVATIEQMITSSPPFEYLFRIGSVTAAQAVDSYTVNVVTKQLDVLLPANISDIFINQAKQIRAGGSDAINANPIGTGLFKFGGRVAGVSVTLTKNADYWGPKAQVDEIVFKPYPEDATRVAALQNREIDIAEGIPPDSAALLEQKGLSIKWTSIGQADMINIKSPTNDPKAALSNVKVRQALNYAVDKDSNIKNILLGYGRKLNGQTVGPDGIGFNSSLEAYPYDPQKAKQLLADAGFANGFPMTIATGQGVYTKSKEVTEALAGQLRQVGVTVTVNLMDNGTMENQMAILEAFYLGWNYFPAMDADFNLQWFVCAGRFKLYCNPDFDKLFAQERSEPDAQKRAGILNQMETILHDQAPAIFMHQEPRIWVSNTRVSGFTATPDNVIHFQPISVTTNP